MSTNQSIKNPNVATLGAIKITHIGSVLLKPTGWVLIKVKTDEGITGIGEAYHGAGVHQIAVDERLT